MKIQEIDFKSLRQWQEKQNGTILNCTSSLSAPLYDDIVPTFEHDEYTKGKGQHKKIKKRAA